MTAPHGGHLVELQSSQVEVQLLPRLDSSDLLHIRYKRHPQTIERLPRTCNSPLQLTHPPRPSVAARHAHAAIQITTSGTRRRSCDVGVRARVARPARGSGSIGPMLPCRTRIASGTAHLGRDGANVIAPEKLLTPEGHSTQPK